jgi:hypothetical protein
MRMDYPAEDEMSESVLSNTLRKKIHKAKPKSKRTKKKCRCDK